MPPVTARVPGTNTTTISYTIPGAGLDVETVRVGIDASLAGSAVTATVTITDQSGVVIATKPQNATIPSGATGSATWALRLDDDTTGTAGGGGIAFDTYPQAGNWLEVETDDSSGSPNGWGTHLADFSTGGMELETGDAELALGQTAGLGIGAFLASHTGIEIRNSGTGSLVVTNRDTDGVRIEDAATSSGQGVKILSDHGPIFVDAKDGLTMYAENTKATLASNNPTPTLGMYLELDNQSLILYTQGGTRIMQINFNGLIWEYHIQTGSAWVADL
jgi:hypothetical protein